MNLRDTLLCTVALIVFASAYTLIRIALIELPPLTVGAIRFILASAFIVPAVIVRYRGAAWKFKKSELPILFGLSLAQIFMPNLLQNIGLEYTTASVASVLQSTTPVFTLVLAFSLLREGVTWRQIGGVIIAMSGVALLSTGGNLSNFAGSQFLGNLLQIGVAASYAVSGIVGKVLLRQHPPLVVVAATFIVGGSLLTICSLGFERSEWPSIVSTTVVLSLLMLSLLYCVGLVAWYSVLQRTRVFRLYVLLFLMPVLAVVISVIVLRESFTILDMVFSVVTLIGVGITEGRRNVRSGLGPAAR